MSDARRAMLRAIQYSRVVTTGYCETCADIARECPLCGGEEFHREGCSVGIALSDDSADECARAALVACEFKSIPLDECIHDDASDGLGWCAVCERTRTEGHADDCEYAALMSVDDAHAD